MIAQPLPVGFVHSKQIETLGNVRRPGLLRCVRLRKWIIISVVNSVSLSDMHIARDIAHPPRARRLLKPATLCLVKNSSLLPGPSVTSNSIPITKHSLGWVVRSIAGTLVLMGSYRRRRRRSVEDNRNRGDANENSMADGVYVVCFEYVCARRLRQEPAR